MKFLPMSIGRPRDDNDLHEITVAVNNHFRVHGKDMIGVNVIKYCEGVSDNCGFAEPSGSTFVATIRTSYGMEAEVKLIDIVVSLFNCGDERGGQWVALCEGASFMNTIEKWAHYQEVRPQLLLARIALAVASYLYDEDRHKKTPELLARVCLTFDEPVKGTA